MLPLSLQKAEIVSLCIGLFNRLMSSPHAFLFLFFVSLSTEKRELWNDRDDDATSPSRTANRQLLEWLENNEVYVSEMSDWGQAPHLLGLSSET